MEEQITLKEKLAFLRGYADASKLSAETKEVLEKIFDFLKELIDNTEEINDKTDSIEVVCDYLENRIETIEDELYSKSDYTNKEEEVE
jgi:gas vesicle protein